MPAMKEVPYTRNIFCTVSIDEISGIDVVRNRIKGFAQKKVTLPPGRHKLVILDEADRYRLSNMSVSGSNY
jgi:DNA polymerase III delta prime subunit